jgi:hypothetical protein
MRFLVGECTGPAVASWLQDNGYEVFSVFEEARGLNDDDIIQKAGTHPTSGAPPALTFLWLKYASTPTSFPLND